MTLNHNHHAMTDTYYLGMTMPHSEEDGHARRLPGFPLPFPSFMPSCDLALTCGGFCSVGLPLMRCLPCTCPFDTGKGAWAIKAEECDMSSSKPGKKSRGASERLQQM